jgi:anti-anti-sigma factor
MLARVGDDSIVVSMTGELDMARDDELLGFLMKLRPVADSVVEVDMSEVSFVDSRGLVSILQAAVYLRDRGCGFRVVRPQQQLVRLIELAGLSDIVPVVDDAHRSAVPVHAMRTADLDGTGK